MERQSAAPGKGIHAEGKEVLRLRFGLGLQQNQIARSCSIGQSTVHRYLEKAAADGLSWPLSEDWFRILTVDQYTREYLCAYADHSQTGEKVVEQMKRLMKLRGLPESITTDNGSEFAGQAINAWAAHQAGVKLDFIQPGRPVQKQLYQEFQRPAPR